MARRKDSPQKAAMREMMRDYLKNNDISIKDGTDVNSIMRDMMSVILEGALDEEPFEGIRVADVRGRRKAGQPFREAERLEHRYQRDIRQAFP